MRIVPFLWCVFVASAWAAGEPHKISFERNDAVWIANLDGSGEKRIAAGASPDLSPDGSRLAFNTVQTIGKPADRRIAVADLASGKITVFQNLPSKNCMQPVWSPDGSRLLFYLYPQQEMEIGIINADGSGFHSVQKSGAEHRNYWGACWARDGKSIFCEDMESIYRLSLHGAVLKKWKVSKIIQNGDLSGDVRFDVSPDGNSLLMDVGMGEEANRKNWDGPLPAIWVLDLTKEKATRLTPKTLFGWDCHWLGSDAILFCSQGAKENGPSIYRMGLNGNDRKLLVKNARVPSAAPQGRLRVES